MDSAGASVINKFAQQAAQKECTFVYENITPSIRQTLDLFTLRSSGQKIKFDEVSFFESIGDSVYEFYDFLKNSLFLLADIFYWSIAAFFKKKLRRRGEVIHQSIRIGVNALPIISIIAFLNSSRNSWLFLELRAKPMIIKFFFTVFPLNKRYMAGNIFERAKLPEAPKIVKIKLCSIAIIID